MFQESGAQFSGRRFAPLGPTGGGDVQIIIALALEVPAVTGYIADFHSVSPDMLLSYDPLGHADHASVACGFCLVSPDCAYSGGTSDFGRPSSGSRSQPAMSNGIRSSTA